MLHVPNLACNLVSISKLTQDLNCIAHFSNDMCPIEGQGLEKMIGIAREKGRLCYFENDECKDKKAIMVEIALPYVLNNNVLLGHYRLGPPNFHYHKHLFPGLFMNKDPKDFHCEICQLAKHTSIFSS